MHGSVAVICVLISPVTVLLFFSPQKLQCQQTEMLPFFPLSNRIVCILLLLSLNALTGSKEDV